jgi:hypothetical protein
MRWLFVLVGRREAIVANSEKVENVILGGGEPGKYIAWNSRRDPLHCNHSSAVAILHTTPYAIFGPAATSDPTRHRAAASFHSFPKW